MPKPNSRFDPMNLIKLIITGALFTQTQSAWTTEEDPLGRKLLNDYKAKYGSNNAHTCEKTFELVAYSFLLQQMNNLGLGGMPKPPPPHGWNDHMEHSIHRIFDKYDFYNTCNEHNNVCSSTEDPAKAACMQLYYDYPPRLL